MKEKSTNNDKINELYKKHNKHLRAVMFTTTYNDHVNLEENMADFWYTICISNDSLPTKFDDDKHEKYYLARALKNRLHERYKFNNTLKRQTNINSFDIDEYNENNNIDFELKDDTLDINTLDMDISNYLLMFDDNDINKQIWLERIYNQLKFTEIGEKYNMGKLDAYNIFSKFNKKLIEYFNDDDISISLDDDNDGFDIHEHNINLIKNHRTTESNKLRLINFYRLHFIYNKTRSEIIIECNIALSTYKYIMQQVNDIIKK